MLTPEEKDRVFAMSLLAVVRRAKAASELKTEEQILKSADVARAEVRNILLEHLTAEQLADMAANELTGVVGRSIMEMMVFSRLKGHTGTPFVDTIIAATEHFCSEKLGYPVKV